jgi:hypothetical protein
MDDAITIETDMFEHREVKPHFINPCCFGEDFAAWMKRELSPLVDDGFTFSEPIQEDYGWGLRAWHGKDPFWVAISYVGDGPQEPPAQWVVSASYDAGLNFIKRLFHKPDSQAFARLRDRVRHSLLSNSAIKSIETEAGSAGMQPCRGIAWRGSSSRCSAARELRNLALRKPIAERASDDRPQCLENPRPEGRNLH